MKLTAKKLGSVIITAALLVPIVAGAEDREDVKLRASTSVDMRKGTTTLKERLEAQKENLKENIENRKEKMSEKRDELQERIRSRFTEFMNRVIKRFNAASERLDKIVARIESRLTKLESEGVDESKARSLLADAKLKLTVAKTSIANISVTASSTAAATTTIKLKYPAVKDAVEKAKTDLKAAHAALIEVVKSIKPGKNKEHATSTTATTTP